MIRHYKNIANCSLAVLAAAFAAIAYFGQGSSTGNVWDQGGAPPILMYIAGISVYVMFWGYAKSKGRSGWLGILLPFLSIIGLIILLALEDKSLPESKDKPQ
jgi:peptidoglycan/LPS O-acetylase OafA/YrhL